MIYFTLTLGRLVIMVWMIF